MLRFIIKAWFSSWVHQRGLLHLKTFNISFQQVSSMNKDQGDLLCSSSEDHDPEDEKNNEPDLPDDGGVGLDLVQ